MIRNLTRAAAAVTLALTLAPTPAMAQTELHGCPPGQAGVVIHYRDPRGWITLDIPLCLDPRLGQ
jgi:hypothetical protein